VSGYVFHCTPCGFPHAGECPPRAEVPTTPKPREVEVTVGSHWSGQRKPPGGTWQPSGWHAGYEVVAIISDGTRDRSRVQVRAWGDPIAPVWTLQVDYWDEEGFDNPMTGNRERMIPWNAP